MHNTDLIGLMDVMVSMTTAWGPRSEAATGAIAVSVKGELEEPGCDSSCINTAVKKETPAAGTEA